MTRPVGSASCLPGPKLVPVSSLGLNMQSLSWPVDRVPIVTYSHSVRSTVGKLSDTISYPIDRIAVIPCFLHRFKYLVNCG